MSDGNSGSAARGHRDDEAGSPITDPQAPTLDALAAIDVDDPEQLGPALRILADSGAARYDPARSCYIQALAARAGQQRPVVADLLARKALRVLRDYRDDFAAARERARGWLDRVSAEAPGREAELAQAFVRGDFKWIERTAPNLLGQSRDADALSGLRWAAPRGDIDDEPQQDGSLATALRQQDRELLQPADRQAAVERGSAAEAELDAMRRLRQSLQAHHAQQRVTRELRVGEEDRGPLNAQALVSRHLAMMHAISPAYARRFVAHMDTLLWLQRVSTSTSGKNKPKRKRRR